MSRRITRRGVTLLTVGALFTVVFAAAPQADAATLYACVKKQGGSMRLVSSRTKCKRSERKVSWSTSGPAGRNGKNGANGTNGKNGANGTNGAVGAAGGFFGVLPSGKTMSGTYAAQGATGQQYRTSVSFLLSLPTAPTASQIHYIKVGEAVPSGCTGTVAAPAAAPGNLCIFEGVASVGNDPNRGEVNPIDDEAPNLSMPVFGFGVYGTCTTAPCIIEGTWAVTAPTG